MHVHPRSFSDRVFTVWRSPKRFTKNPDIVSLSSGRLLLIYSDTDGHWAQESEILTLLRSDDGGLTWQKHCEVATARQPDDERLVTPRLSHLHDGRLVVICDHDDYGHFHEDQWSGNWAWWSSDDGHSWSAAQGTGIAGFEPDRMIDLPDGSLAVASHVMRRTSQEFAEILSVSTDGGRSWTERATVAHDGYHRFCEGALVLLDDGRQLACVMRENHSAGIPCFVAFSSDCGHTWSEPQTLPFALHRPYGKELPDGRVFVTGRHVNGGVGTYGWCGDLHEAAGRWSVGGPRGSRDVTVIDGTLVIDHARSDGCRYSLLPPESARSAFTFEAVVRVEGPVDEPIAIMSIGTHGQHGGASVVYLSSGRVGTSFDRPDRFRPMDLTRFRTVTMRHHSGLFDLRVDGCLICSGCVFGDQAVPSEFHGADPLKRTTFGQIGDKGRSHWKSVRYRVQNQTLPDVVWEWDASRATFPDQYQRDHLVQMHANDPHRGPDHGYSSWLLMDDGRIMWVDYTNLGDDAGTSHIVGLHFRPEEL